MLQPQFLFQVRIQFIEIELQFFKFLLNQDLAPDTKIALLLISIEGSLGLSDSSREDFTNDRIKLSIQVKFLFLSLSWKKIIMKL